ncbi:CD276 antigen homolog [Oreochromis aureus]|uniref:CD276 antigen homolog n=1 Tax=Oreochromis aureus TaxID=47969 RepID=UPI0019534B30|nr:CD276 antigen homolog [Oreochromis aureus]
MSAVTESLYLAFLFVVFVCADQKTITAESGQDVTLTCRAPKNKIRAVKWSRADLGDEYVFWCKGGWFILDYQHPSFKNRVDLQDRQMKAGDVSLILKNVRAADDGIYMCHVNVRGTRSTELISIITLRVVDPPGQTGGSTVLMFVGVVLLSSVTGGVFGGACGLVTEILINKLSRRSRRWL